MAFVSCERIWGSNFNACTADGGIFLPFEVAI